MTELALDDDERHAFSRQLDGVGVAELVRPEAAANASCDSGVTEGGAGGSAGPLAPTVGSLTTHNDGPMGSPVRSCSQGVSSSRPHASMPTSRRRSPLPRRNEHGAAALIEIELGERERLVDAQPGAPQHRDQAAQPNTVRVVTGRVHDGDDLLDLGGGSAGYRTPLFARRTAHMESPHGRRRPAATGAIAPLLSQGRCSGS